MVAGYLFKLSGWLTQHISTNETMQETGFGQANFLAALTKPLTSKIIQVIIINILTFSYNMYWYFCT